MDLNRINERLDAHESRLEALEASRLETGRLLERFNASNEKRLEEVREGLEGQIKDLKDESRRRDEENSKRLDRVEKKLDAFSDKLDRLAELFGQAIKKAPAWVWPLVTSLIAVAGWLIGKKG